MAAPVSRTRFLFLSCDISQLPKDPWTKTLDMTSIRREGNCLPQGTTAGTGHSETPVKPALTDEDTLPCKMVATKIIDFSLNEQCIGNEQCVSVCCQNYPGMCKNVSKPKLVDCSTPTIDIVSHYHSYRYSEKTRNASTQHNSPEFGAEYIETDSDSQFYTELSLATFLTLVATLSKFGQELPRQTAAL
ncbi:hypothetical protein DPMN_163707 [Dreissena polymorpha]|uniref:Uncharacterized protein n=1 Tax=Dreissena polymorpha TaxID=45954 RepID=A0A9D4IUN6_DREPO|nr:hypothetical protein DPMN_163707 [Dreissena polymorpha]